MIALLRNMRVGVAAHVFHIAAGGQVHDHDEFIIVLHYRPQDIDHCTSPGDPAAV